MIFLLFLKIGDKFGNDENVIFVKLLINIDGYFCELKEV